MIQLHPTCRRSIDSGDFPLNHDCILKVEFIYSAPIRFAYYSCRAQESAQLIDILSKVPMVQHVYTSSVDDLSDTF